ncbi:hypothetical protein HZA26_03645 [Candidatus Nomurabacteria bacterium]|nr:hypothetical protein [Candidatus Nomurabacteria bacterium]
MNKYLEALRKLEENRQKLKDCQKELRERKKKPVRPCQSARKRRKARRDGLEVAAEKAYATKMAKRKK